MRLMKRIVPGVAGMLVAALENVNLVVLAGERVVMLFGGQKQRQYEMQHGCATRE
jgi:ABC-type phosphate/phosphonate transport system ATPase subunit